MKAILVFLFLLRVASAQDLRLLRVETYFRETAGQILEQLPAQQRSTLSTSLRSGVVEVVERELVDNGGSLVDALGIRGKVTLSYDRWMSFIREGRDVRLLILHELLRMNGQNDDGYAISRILLPQRANSSMRSYCDLRVSQTTMREVRREVTGVGYAPMNNSGVIMMGPGMDNSQRDRAMAAAIIDIRERCLAAGYESFGHGPGELLMERRNSNGVRSMQFRVNLSGVCAKNEPTQRAIEDQRVEGCHKVSFCRDLIQDGVIAPLQRDDQVALERLERRWRCP